MGFIGNIIKKEKINLVKYVFVVLFMIFGVLFILILCGEVVIYIKININEYVFVRVINLSDNLYKYGVFRFEFLENEVNVV